MPVPGVFVEGAGVGVFRIGIGVGVGVAICLGIDIRGVGVGVGFCCICASSPESGCEGVIWVLCRGAHALSSARINSPRRNQHLLRTRIQNLLLSTFYKATFTSLTIVTRTGTECVLHWIYVVLLEDDSRWPSFVSRAQKRQVMTMALMSSGFARTVVSRS